MAEHWDRDRWDRFGGNRNDYRDDYRDDRAGDYGVGGGFGGGGFNTMNNRDFETRGGYDRGWDYGSTQQQSFRGRGPKGFQRSDDRLRELVSERLSDHHDIDASDIEVTVSNGEVTLQGTVDDRRTKRLAEDVVESVSGVRDVHNQLRVDREFFTRNSGAAG
ncbi:MAG: BON domain-containing protein [Thermoanaerobaculia bacterium]